MYNIDFDIFAIQLLPTFLRKEKLIAFLIVLISPIKQLFSDFIIFKASQENKIIYTSQIIYFEKILNDTYDNVNRGIKIEDCDIIPYTYLNNIAEQKSTYLYNKSENLTNIYLYNKSEHNSLYDFTVRVHISVYNQLIADNRLDCFIGLIEFYKLAGKRYIINTN